ncbi:hypothetical protein N9B21_01520 [Verrucomicrobiales bacterium]|jgi:hypothetical protein|nr:hypothetical protein [Verrucomicrobiales bacterium]|tara:strand:- start:442 stop:1095 length:654 start_codon:yes stop_codon:yes gene_type:complete
MATGFHNQSTRFRAFTLVFGLLAGLSTAFTQDAEEVDEPAKRMGIIIGGTFEGAEVTQTPSGAENTLLIASYEWDYGVRYFTEKTWSERGFDWAKFLPAAQKVADDILDTIEPEYARDSRGIIEYVILNSEDPFLSSVLISPKLVEKFGESLGDRIQAVVVDRQMIYLFPATGGKLEAFGKSLVDAFQKAKLPVSLEVFLINESGARVVGELGQGGE